MMLGIPHLILVILLTLLAGRGFAQSFHLVAPETPPVTGYGQPVERISIAGTGGTAIALPFVPASATDDPASVAFRSPFEMFVGNRAGHTGNGSISVFFVDSDFGDFVAGPTLTGNGLTDVHQIAFDSVSGELFATNWTSGILSRFTFDPLGRAVPNGVITMPDSARQLGVAVRAADQQLFVSSYTNVRRFVRGPGGGYTYAGSFGNASASGLHYMSFRGDELYLCDVHQGAVFRYVFDAVGLPVPHGSVAAPGAIAAAFSPDGQEMFVADHFSGGISRFLYQAGTDDWLYQGLIVTPSLGGLAISPGDPTGTSDLYGAGCPAASGDQPTLAAIGASTPGALVLIRVTDALPSTSGLLVLGLAPLDLPIGGGCRLLVDFVDPSGLLPLDTDPDGNLFIPITVPPGLPPTSVFMQYAFVDPALTTPLAIAATNGLGLSL